MLCVAALFYNFPYVADFTTDVLVGCPSESVRTSAVRLLRDLCHINPQSGDVERPLYFVLSHLLKARLPFWVSSSITRGTNYRYCFMYSGISIKIDF